MTVRDLAAGDVESCLDGWEAVVDEGQWLGAEPPFDRAERRQRLQAGMDAPGRAQLVAVNDEGAVVGHLGLEVVPYGVAQFGMWVAQDWRGKGVGSALVEAAVAAARRQGAHKVSIQVWPHNHPALRLYRRHGFVEEGLLRRHYARRNGQLWDAVMMGLVLDEERPGSELERGG